MIPIVAIGASAGGLEQISRLLGSLPGDTGAAFVVIQHLAPTYRSQLSELLGRSTELPVITIRDGLTVASDRVHVIPAGHSLTIKGDVLHLVRDEVHETVPTLIDRFFESLARERRERAIGIVLSGSGSDGANGLKAINDNGGLTLAQDPDTAEHDGMPRAAVQASTVAVVDETAGLVAPLVTHLRRLFDASATDAPAAPGPGAGDDETATLDAEDALTDEQLDRTLHILRDHRSRNSFDTYKPNMLKRRIKRRMALHQLDQHADYERLLRDDGDERAALGQDFLIRVTSFFREPDTYKRLAEHAIHPLLEHRDVDDPIRVWVPGCATGEEAYSIAILLAEAIEASGKNHSFIIFASDIDQRALDIARTGVHPDTIASDLTDPQLRMFFDKIDHHYQVKRFLREQVVFAAQDVIADPPYSQLDLISCRNVLMYLESETQKRVISLFHFALKNDAILFLGNAETVGSQIDLFESLDDRGHLFQRVNAHTRRREIAQFAHRRAPDHESEEGSAPQAGARPVHIEQIARDILLKHHVPASVLISKTFEVLCSYGPTGDYLALPFGQSSFDLMSMVRDEFRSQLRAVTHQAVREGIQHQVMATLSAEPGQGTKITARPLKHPEAARGLILVTFEPEPVIPKRTESDSEDTVEHQLASELEATRSELQSTIDALEAANEDLKGSNEEILSMNEELQSTNEELETSKEELQSLNEELTTVNTELEHKVGELETAHNDLHNLFAGTQVATLFLDRAMRIKRFTPAIKGLLSLISSDIGRPLSDITLRFEDPDLEHDADAVIGDLMPREREVRTRDNAWYLRRIVPYRTRDNAIDGIVITFADITDLKQASLATAQSEQRLDTAMTAINGGTWEVMLDPENPGEFGDNLYLSPRLKRLLGFEPDQLPDSLSAWQARIDSRDRAAFSDIARRTEDTSLEGLEYRISHRDGSIRWFASYGTVVRDNDGHPLRWTGIDCDITETKQREGLALQAQERLQLLANAVRELVVFVDRERVIRFTNTAYEEWFGVAAREVVDRTLEDVMEKRAYETLTPCVETALEGRAITCDVELEHRKQGRHTLQVHHLPYVAGGEVIGFYALMTNVTNRKRRQVDSLEQQSNLVYVHRMATVGEMASALAHDLKQPLTTINTYASALTRMLHAGEPAEDTTPIVRKIADQVERAGTIVGQTREFVGRQDSGYDAIDINTVVNHVIALTEGRARKMHIDIRSAMDSSLPATTGYPVQIEQVVVNLFNNAFDAMEDTPRDERVLWVATEMPEQDHVQIVVRDSGPGIPAEKIAAIFNSFHTTKLEGMGMGLSISRSIAQWHGGRLWAESQAGNGAAFFLKLPVAASRANDDTPTAAPGETPDKPGDQLAVTVRGQTRDSSA